MPRTAQPTRPQPFRHGIRAEAVSVVGQPKPGDRATDGRWRLNSGAVMQQWLPFLHPDPVDVVIDLSTVRFARPEIHCIWDHFGAVIGRWQQLEVVPTGDRRGVYGTLLLYTPTDDDPPEVRERMAEAMFVRALLARDHPWEASVGEDTRHESAYQLVRAGESVTVNGEQITPGQRPLYVVRDMTVDEASIVVFGADFDTARVAAARHLSPAPTNPPKDPLMPKPRKTLSAIAATRGFLTSIGVQAASKLGERIVEAIDEEVSARVAAASDDEMTEDEIRAQVMDEVGTATGLDLESMTEMESPTEEVIEALIEVLPVDRAALDEAMDDEEEENSPTGGDGTAAAVLALPGIKGHEREALRMLAAGKSVDAIRAHLLDQRLARLEGRQRATQAAGNAGTKATATAPRRGAADEESAPTSYLEARSLVATETKLKGRALNRAVAQRYPDLAAKVRGS